MGLYFVNYHLSCYYVQPPMFSFSNPLPLSTGEKLILYEVYSLDDNLNSCQWKINPILFGSKIWHVTGKSLS